jgi:hypothetical protein
MADSPQVPAFRRVYILFQAGLFLLQDDRTSAPVERGHADAKVSFKR